MASAVINKVGQDTVEIEFIQSGNHQTQINLDRTLLDGGLNYHFSVVELSVPLNKCPLHPITRSHVLFRIQKRYAGQSLTNPPGYTETLTLFLSQIEFDTLSYNDLQDICESLGIDDTGAPEDLVERITEEYARLINEETTEPLYLNEFQDEHGTNFFEYSITPDKPLFTIQEFVKDMNGFANNFNEAFAASGIDPDFFGLQPSHAVDPSPNDNHHDLRFGMSCDGSLEIILSKIFIDCFCIEFTEYGSSLIGIDTGSLQTVDNRHFLAFTLDDSSESFVGDAPMHFFCRCR